MPVHTSSLVLGHNPVQRIAHISPHVLIPVLVQRQRARRVLNEEIQQARLIVLNLGELLDDDVGDEVGPAAARWERQLLLEPGLC